MNWVIGVDVGGTFTDFYAIEQETGRSQVHKAPSTPANPAEAIVRGVLQLCRQAAIDPRAINRLEHGTTIGTNALIQRRGARVALITTAGFRDLLEIGRQIRPHMFDLQRDQPTPLVPRHLRFEVDERLLADGKVRRALTSEEAERVVRAVLESDVEACAICLLFSFMNVRHERMIGETFARLAPDFPVSLSCEVQPEFREFERLSTTVLNAYLQPLVGRYLDSLKHLIERDAGAFPIGISQSSGGIMSIRRARDFPVRTALSGPAAGAMGAVSLARCSEQPQAITLDMGGTSTDVCMIRDYAASVAPGRSVADFPIKLSMVDIETIGAGGGSIAWMERDGLLKVGPVSAGADPGPACYGAG
ncbi:MAG: hydantoinase/oxoprolinase N-terminal domain-containing protein, partial [Parvibaculaceae bacterium]